MLACRLHRQHAAGLEVPQPDPGGLHNCTPCTCSSSGSVSMWQAGHDRSRCVPQALLLFSLIWVDPHLILAMTVQAIRHCACGMCFHLTRLPLPMAGCSTTLVNNCDDNSNRKLLDAHKVWFGCHDLMGGFHGHCQHLSIRISSTVTDFFSKQQRPPGNAQDTTQERQSHHEV